MTVADQRAIIRAYQASSNSITTNLLSYLTRAWSALPGWRDANAGPWIAQILPVVEGAAAQQGALTDAYLSRLLGDMLGEPVAPKGFRPPTIRDLRGVPGTEVYARPFVTTRAAIAKGFDLRTAAARGLERLMDLAATDMQLTSRGTSRRVLAADDRVVGYRRVLKGGKTCGMCAIASTQRYHRENLLPIHPGCQCKVAPIVGATDPGQVINRPLLDSTHDAIAAEFGDDAVTARADTDAYTTPKAITVYDHGEYGPTLAVAGQHHTIL